MTTKVPNKPAAASVSANLAIVLVWVAGQFNLEVPAEVASAFTALLAGAVYYLVPQERG